VDHRHAQLLLQVALLPRDELVVAGDQVRVRRADQPLQVGDLAPAEVAIGVRLGSGLRQLTRGRDTGGPQKLLELGERVLAMLAAANDAHRNRTLPGARVDDAGGPVGRDAAVAVAVHSPDGRTRWGPAQVPCAASPGRLA